MATDRIYINDSLVHWTGRCKDQEEAFSILGTICDEQILRLSFCPTHVQPDLQPRITMVCFTDIPLEHSHVHCSKFGRFGIAFKKSSMIAYGANPVLYTTGKHLGRIRLVYKLLDRMRDQEKDREWRDILETYSYNEDELVALLEVIGLLQEYSYKNQDGSDYLTYYQREWRLMFNVLPFAGGTSEHVPGKSCFYKKDGKTHPIFKFCAADVAYLIVPRQFEISALKFADALGCEVKIYEDVVHV